MENVKMRPVRPKHLDLAKIRLPLPGLVSILHRITGIALFLSVPFLLYLLSGALGTPESFEAVRQMVSQPLLKLLAVGLVWALLHHLLAGLRFLAADVHLGLELEMARLLSKGILVAGAVLAVAFGVAIW